VRREHLDRLPALRAIVNFGVGYDRTDVAEAARRGIVVANTPDVLTDCVADTAVGLVIDVMRGLSAADRFVRRGEWAAGRVPDLARRVTGARIGILGLGRIGLAIARRLAAFEATISYHNRRRREDVDYTYAASPRELAAGCDVLVVAAAGGQESRGLVDADVLDGLGPEGFLVNVARGSVVDEDALLAALGGGRLAGAALDVFADEPHVPAALLARDDVVLLPHLGSATVETRAAMTELALANVARFLDDGTLLTPVDPG
jgi:lactate dehydrogenase-like 2-hydroxyacid dehydrogenase